MHQYYQHDQYYQPTQHKVLGTFPYMFGNSCLFFVSMHALGCIRCLSLEKLLSYAPVNTTTISLSSVFTSIPHPTNTESACYLVIKWLVNQDWKLKEICGKGKLPGKTRFILIVLSLVLQHDQTPVTKSEKISVFPK